MIRQIKDILLSPRRMASDKELGKNKLWRWITLSWLSLFWGMEIINVAFFMEKGYGSSQNHVFIGMMVIFGFATFFFPFVLWGLEYGAAYLISGHKILPREFFQVWIPFSAVNSFVYAVAYSIEFLFGVRFSDHTSILQIVNYLLLLRFYYSVYWVLKALGVTKIRCWILIILYAVVEALMRVARI